MFNSFTSQKYFLLRPCIDYCRLNQFTKKYRYSLPLVPAALKQLHSAHMFTKLDLRRAYNMAHIREGDEWKNVSGHYEYCVMPYGLFCTPLCVTDFHQCCPDGYVGKICIYSIYR